VAATSRLASCLPALLCAGCGGWQSALQPGGEQAGHLKVLIQLFTIVCGIVWLLVMLVLAAGLWRRHSGTPTGAAAERRSARLVGAATAASVLVIIGLTLASYVATHGLAAAGADPLVIRVRGSQWWWEVTYMDPSPDRTFLTANEIHVPVGRPIRVELAASDVIHSFWAPNLAGKQDLIPGRDNALSFTVDQPGLYREQCAEFCGLQHAHMAMLIVAEPAASFDAWRDGQIAEPPAPNDAEQAAGRLVFTGKACAACHTVRGTPAAGTLGPDLTHVGSRRTIAAGMLPTTRGSLAAWIADPQTIKPGNNMPMVPLTADELNALAAYLASLK